MGHTTGWTNPFSHKYAAAQRRRVPVFTRGARARRRPVCELCVEPQA
jgi:hypothetical protein